jgi:hypothetical protein
MFSTTTPYFGTETFVDHGLEGIENRKGCVHGSNHLLISASDAEKGALKNKVRMMAGDGTDAKVQ